MARRRQQAGCLNVSLGCLFVTVISIGSVAVFVNNQRVDNQRQAQQLNVQKPVGTLERLQHDIGNNCKLRLVGDSLMVEIDAGDGFTNAMAISSTHRNITRAIKEIAHSGIRYSEVNVSVYSGFIDKFGNKSRGRAIYASFKRSTISKINWSNFLPENILEIADSNAVHPSFK